MRHKMREKLFTALQIFLLIFAIFGHAKFSVQPAHAKEIVKERTQAPRSKVYLIDVSDVLNITVFEEPDLSMTIRVAENGKISFPLVGRIYVEGLTTNKAEKLIEKLLKSGEFLVTPIVNIRLDIELMQMYSEKEIFIMGEVKKTGPITILGKYISTLEAINKAGGFTEFAAPNRTTIIRMENGKEKTITVNLNKVKKGNKALDIMLKAGDVVIVPEAYF